MAITKVTGAKGAKGKNGANPTAGGNGDNATFSQNGKIGADSITLQVNGGDGGIGGNKTGAGAGANGGNGGNASATLNGNIFNTPATTTLSVLATSTGGDGGIGGTGTTLGLQGNGGNGTVTMNGNILQPSKTMTTIELNAHAIGGNGTRHGNANATLNGNIIQPTKATTVVLEAFAEVVGDSTTHHGDSSWGTKTATLNGNIVQGNINNVNLIADASISNSTASVNGNILNLSAASTGTVSLFVQGEHIAVTNNKFNLGKQEFDFAVSQYAPAYDVSIKGNEFTGTGSNIFVFTDNGVPGPDVMHDTGAIDLMTNAFVFGADSNKITKFGVFTVHGNNIDFTFGGDNIANTFNGGDGKDNFTGLGGNDALDGGAGSDTAFYTGPHTQYMYSFSHVGNLAGTVTDTVAGRDGTDTLTNVEFIKFSDGTYDVVNNTFTPNGGGNHAPVAVNDTFTTSQNAALTVAGPGVLGNDTDADADPLTAALVAGPANGMLTLNPNGSFTYTPNANFTGADSFTYRANDGTANSNTATVNITVSATNHAPVAVNDTFATNEDTPLTVAGPGVLGNDTDADANPLTAALVAGPANGLLTLNPNGSFTYTPNANFNGSDSFTYRANDGTANSNTATVNITVNAVNDAPVAVNDAFATNEDTPLTIALPGVLGNDSDVEGNSLTAALVAGPANGLLTLNPNGSFTYTPNANFNGTDSFTYRANDGTANSNTATVNITVNPVNDAPVAVNDTFAINEDTPLTVAGPGVLGNDTDVDGNPLTAVLVAGPANGLLTLNPNGSFTYTPNANFNGADSFTYRANDGTANSNTATVNITVNPVNDAPVAADDTFNADFNTPLTILAPGVLGNDTDVDGDSLTAPVFTAPTHGMLTFNPNGSFTYTPNANYTGADSFTYRASDGTALSNIATVNINVSSGQTINGTPGPDNLMGTVGNDTINGLGGDDILDGLAGNDTLNGDGGDDTLKASAGNDILNGGANTAVGDTADFSNANAGVTISLSAGGAQGFSTAQGPGTVTLNGIENLSGSGFGDTLTGDANANTLSGQNGNDLLIGGGGNDVIDGGTGIDVAQFSSQPTAAQVTSNGTSFTVAGPDGTDTLTNVEVLDDAGGGARILLVGAGGFATINDAIAAANAGDTIMIAPGTYNENVVIDKQLTVIGAGPGVVIHGTFKSDNGLAANASVADFLKTAPGYNGNAGTGILIKADGVVLTNLTVDGFLDGVALGNHAANQLDPLNKGTVNGLTLNNVNLQSSVNGFSKFDGWKLNNLSINGGTISDDYIGVYLYNDIVGAEDATNTAITGTTFNHLTQKGIYTETLQGATSFSGLMMNDVGQYGGGVAFGAQGANGAGIDVNLKFHNYNGSSIDISGFDFTNVGASTGLDATGHKNAAAIAIKGRDDGSYAANPATVTGLAVTIHDGVIDGTSTGIRAGEAKDAAGSNVTGPAVTITNVDIDNNLVNAKHDQIDNRTNSTMTVNGTAGADVYHSAQALASTGSIIFNGLGGNDDFLGGLGNDVLDGGANDDKLSGSGGNDLLIGGSGNDIIDGGTGIDTAQFSSQPTAGQVSWNGTAYVVTGPDGTDTITNVENLDDAGGGSKILLVGGGGYATINAAIAAANAGDTIMIAPGTYTENVLIDKQLTVIGAGPGVIIHGTFSSDNGIAAPTLGTPDPVNHFLQTAPGYSGAAGTGILVSASGVTLTNITVEDYLDAIGTSGAVSNLTLNGVTMQHSVNGFAKHDGSSLTGLNVNGGDINDTYIGAYFYNDDVAQKLTSNATNTTFTGTTFEHITQKGIYAETLQGNTTLDGLVMNDVGQYGGGVAFGAQGANGAGIDVNLKFNTYAGNLNISNFDFDNVGASTGLDATGHKNAAAIAIKGRDDGSYAANPADVSGLNVTIQNGTIDGTSTGIRAGEAKDAAGSNVTGPAVTITNVDIDNNLVNAKHDQIDNRTNSTMTINGTAGADVYHSAQALASTGPITFNGLGGNDDFEGGLGNDILNGGANDDTLMGSGGNDQINGGAADHDTAVYTGTHLQYNYAGVNAAGNGTIIDSVGGRDGTDMLTSIETLRFSDGSVNTATGVFTSNGPANTAPVANNDAYTVDVNTPLVIAPPGVLGNDTDADLNPLTVSFVSMPSHGSLTLNPDGSFTYNPTAGYVGADSFTYMANDGTANSNAATVNITVSAGQTLTGTAGNDTLAPGNGDDTLIATTGNDTLDGGGNFVFGDTASFINATSGVSVNLTQANPIDLTGSGLGMVTLLNIEHLTGSAFNDTLRGNTGNNVLTGGAGNDTLIATKGTDTLDGGADSDTADFRLATAGVTVSTTSAGLNLAGSGLGTVTLLNIENLTGGDFDDTLTGDAGDNNLKGGDGNDTFIATGSGATGDTYTGGNGNDTVSFTNATSGVTVSTAIAGFQNLTNSGLGKVKLVTVENITGSSFADTLTGDAGDNVLSGAGGNDTIVASGSGATFDLYDGGAGIDTVTYAGGTTTGVTVNLGNGGTQAVGGGFGTEGLVGIENLIGTGFDDTLLGDGNNNYLVGGAGSDTLVGGGGTLDILNGGLGNDTLDGTIGSATDVAHFAGRETSYAITGMLGTLGVQVSNGVDATDTANFIDRVKFLSPTHVSDLDNNGVGDLVLQNTATGAISYSLGNGFAAPVTLGAASPPVGFNVVGTGLFTPDAQGTNARASGILVQDQTVGGSANLFAITNISGTTATVSNIGANLQFQGFTAVGTGDFNGDAASDILLQDANGDIEIAFLNGSVGAAVGTLNSIKAVASPAGAGWRAISSGDFNGDGFSDIMFQNTGTGDVQIDLMRGSDVMATGTLVPSPGTGLKAIGTGDFNGDGKSDILFQNTANGRATIWTMDGTTRLGVLPNVAQPAGTTLLGAQDIDGNGFSDLLWQNAATGKVIATPFDSTGNLANVTLLNTSTSHLIAANGGG